VLGVKVADKVGGVKKPRLCGVGVKALVVEEGFYIFAL